MGEKQFKMLFVLSIYDSSSILTCATDIVCAKRISEKCGKLNKVRIQCMRVFLWQINLYAGAHACRHGDTNSRAFASAARIEIKLISLISVHTLAPCSLRTYPWDTRLQVNFNVIDTKGNAEAAICSFCQEVVCVCRCARALVCVRLQYVQCDWLGIGLFICLVWSWLCNWA